MTIIARNKVSDINAFLKGHQDRLALFASAVSSWQTFQDTNDPKSVVMVIGVTDIEQFQTILNDPSNAAMRDRDTVLEPVIISTPVAY